MCLLFETIKLQDGVFKLLDYHNNRMDSARQHFFRPAGPIDLKKELRVPENCKKGLFKCKVVYGKCIQDVSFSSYKNRDINALKLVDADGVDYPFKYVDRGALDKLTEGSDPGEEILIVKNGKITDTSYTNVCLWDGKKWLTPARPLLKGTKRQHYLDKGQVSGAEISVADLKKYEKISLINAMLDLGDIVLKPNHLAR